MLTKLLCRIWRPPQITPPNDVDLYVCRELDHLELTDIIIDSLNQNTDGAISICGSPGTGKSTLISFLVHELKTKHKDTDFYKLDLYEYASSDIYSNGGSLSINHFISFFNDIEKILRSVTKPNVEPKIKTTTESRFGSNFSFINEDELSDDPFVGVTFILGEILYQHVRSVKKRLVIFCDNIDFVPVQEQSHFITLLGKLTRENELIKCVFSSRPMTSARVRYAFRTFLTDSILENFHLTDIDIADLLIQRFRRAGKSPTDFLEDSAIELCRKLSAGNNDNTLTVAKVVYNSSKKVKKIPIKDESLMKICLNNQIITDPFLKNNQADRLPIFWCILAFLPAEKVVDNDFYKSISKFLVSVHGNPIKRYKPRSLNDDLDFLLESYFIRRVDFTSKESAENILKDKTKFFGSIISLTERGLTVLQWSRNIMKYSPYFERYPIEVRNFVSSFDTSKHSFTPENPNLGYYDGLD